MTSGFMWLSRKAKVVEISYWIPFCVLFADGKLIPEHRRRRSDLARMGPGHCLEGVVLGCLENDSNARPTTEKIIERLTAEKEKVQRKTRIAATGAAKLKFLALGGVHVGKTCILEKFVNPAFDTKLDVIPTIGTDGLTTTISHNGVLFSLFLVDTAGQERFKSIPPILFRDLDAILLVFDISEPTSFDKIPGVLQMVSSHSRYDISMVLVGNKTDQTRKVTQQKAEKFAREIGMPYIETSAKTGHNIDRLFEMVVQMVYDRLDLGDIENFFPRADARNEESDGGLCEKFRSWFR